VVDVGEDTPALRQQMDPQVVLVVEVQEVKVYLQQEVVELEILHHFYLHRGIMVVLPLHPLL